MKTFGIILLIMLVIFGLGAKAFLDHASPEHEHSYGEWTTKTPATCTEAGVEVRACECNDEETREIPATGHTYGEWETKTPANCTDAEVEVRKCACGAEETREGDAATGHSFGEWQTRTEPDCDDAGEEFRACACGAEETNVLAATGHTYGEWETKTPANCTDAEVEVRKCACGAEETREGDAATGHTYTSISATYNKEIAMEHDVVSASDFTVTATCGCDYSTAVTEGITLENNTLALGDNTVTVKFGDLSTTVTLNAVEFNKVVNGSVVDDTYVYSASGSQDKNYVSQPELSANGDNFRVLLRYNFSDFLASSYYQAYKAEAKVQFTFTITSGTVSAEDKITFKVYPISADRSSVSFSDLTWKTYDDEPHALGWGNAYGFVEKVANSDKVAIDGSKITITVAYRELDQFIDENGDAIFVFAIWKSSTKVGSMENDTVDNRPTVQVVLNDEHIHAFINETVDEKYLISANCTEKAKYYVSCSCGEAGTKTFEHGEVIEHNYSDWTETQAPTCTVEGVQIKTCGNCGDTQTEAIPVIEHSYSAVVTPPTCTAEGYTTHTCSCGDTYTDNVVGKLPHTYGDWLHDESYHWQACSCGDVANKATHAGGEATETEQAVCDTCKQPYGGLASHVHNYNTEVTEPTCTAEGYTTYTCACGSTYTDNVVDAKGHSFGDWATKTPADCLNAEVEVRSCTCGAEETQTGDAALNHNMETKFDADNHWTKCSRCDEATEPVAHFGGEATETEKAVCEGCNQSYGELKEAPKQEYTISGTIVEDTYVASDSGAAKNADYSTSKNTLGIGSKYYRAYFKFNISDVINSADFDPNSTDAKIQFVFTLAKGALDDKTEFTFGIFNPGEGVSDVAFSNLIWNNISPNTGTPKYPNLKWDKAHNLIDTKANDEHVTIDGSTVTLTFNYSDISDYVDANGNLIVTLRTSTTGVSIASMENTTYAIPAIKYVYYK